METNARLDELYAHLTATRARLQPLLQVPLTQEENARRTSLIREEMLPIRNQIIEIESGLCR